MKPRIVLFDDDISNLNLYSGYFSENFVCETFLNPFHFEQALEINPDIIILDVLMPILDGPSLHNKIINHNKYNGCPIFFISSSESDEVLMSALKSGGQGFLSRSMTKEEILYRVKNQIHYFKNNRIIYALGEVKIDMKELRAYKNDSVVELTLTELKILRTLLIQYPNFITRSEITEEIWPGQIVQSNTLNTHLSNLRGKFSNWSYEIQHIKNQGIIITPKA